MVLITLSTGRRAIVDDEDCDLADFTWCDQPNSRGSGAHYATRSEFGTTVRMHRLIAERMGLDIAGRCIDHINGDGLDNRRSNLRLASGSENQFNKRRSRSNSSGYKGVSYHVQRGKWQARIAAYGWSRSLGLFDSAVDAARAYDEAAKLLHGEFACLNFPTG